MRLFGPELSRLPAGLFVGLARWLAAPPSCVDTCARGGNQLTLQVLWGPLVHLPSDFVTPCIHKRCAWSGSPGHAAAADACAPVW